MHLAVLTHICSTFLPCSGAAAFSPTRILTCISNNISPPPVRMHRNSKPQGSRELWICYPPATGDCFFSFFFLVQSASSLTSRTLHDAGRHAYRSGALAKYASDLHRPRVSNLLRYTPVFAFATFSSAPKALECSLEKSCYTGRLPGEEADSFNDSRETNETSATWTK